MSVTHGVTPPRCTRHGRPWCWLCSDSGAADSDPAPHRTVAGVDLLAHPNAVPVVGGPWAGTEVRTRARYALLIARTPGGQSDQGDGEHPFGSAHGYFPPPTRLQRRGVNWPVLAGWAFCAAVWLVVATIIASILK